MTAGVTAELHGRPEDQQGLHLLGGAGGRAMPGSRTHGSEPASLTAAVPSCILITAWPSGSSPVMCRTSEFVQAALDPEKRPGPRAWDFLRRVSHRGHRSSPGPRAPSSSKASDAGAPAGCSEPGPCPWGSRGGWLSRHRPAEGIRTQTRVRDGPGPG